MSDLYTEHLLVQYIANNLENTIRDHRQFDRWFMEWLGLDQPVDSPKFINDNFELFMEWFRKQPEFVRVLDKLTDEFYESREGE